MRRLPFVAGLPLPLLVVLLSGAATQVQAAKFISVNVLDKDYLVVSISDGDVTHNEGAAETVTRYTPALSTSAAANTANWTLTSSQDGNYGTAGKHPLNCYRKTKLSGHGQMEWVGSDFRYEYTYQHWIFLKLPNSLQQGMTYTLAIASATNSDVTSASVTFDIYNSRSEAVHVNLVGYVAGADHKAADLYQWMGDGGARDYSSFQGNTVYVYDVGSGLATPIGLVTYWKPSGGDVFGFNLTRSAVWNADFPGFTSTGSYRLVVEGVGCSQDFTIASNVYANPFRVTLRGFYYMRIGQDNPTGISPPPRTPLYIPGTSPSNTTVYLTTVTPWDSSWSAIPSDQWDNPNSWAAYRKAGNPTNPNAWGGHSDAADWDRHLGHVSIIYDMLLPYILTGGALSDDSAGIRESGNGIPDIIDEARYEVDFWLRLRDGSGYSHGVTNPNSNNELFQAGPTAMAAWANAANAAMLAEAFRIAGQTTLMNSYRDAAVTAYNTASGLSDQQLDTTQDVGYTTVRGRDLKMTAAAFLYNVTGDQAYENVVNAESVCTTANAELENATRNQTWATAAYLLTPRTVHYPTLQSNMKASVINEAKNKEANLIESRPSRRATDDRPGYFRTSQNVQRTMIAHKVADSQGDRDLFRKALALEADWGLGRNPLNMIEMGTATTPLASKRSVEYMYTSGRDDGVAGIDPGHTPYLNLDDWYCGMTMGCPSTLYTNGYPADFKNTWPIAEGYFNSPWVWAHSEFTPQQTMRGKTALYGYLYAIGGGASNPTLTVSKSGSGSGTVTSSPAGINCGSTCSASYASGTGVTLTAAAAGGSTFAGWSGACSGTGTCAVTMSANQSVTATFNLVSTRGTYGNNGNPWAIASSGTTRIQAENYDTGGEGVAFHDSDTTNSGGQYRSDGVDVETTTDTGGGTNVGWIAAGEWLEYTVNVAAAGTYDLKLRLARQPTGTSAMSVAFGGIDKTGSLTVPSTGGWQTWTDVTKTGVSLSAGQQYLRITMVGADFNVNWIEVTAAAAPTYALTVSKSGTGSGTVTSSPAGINCGGTCSASYTSGTSVTLTAAAASGSSFAGWSGACTGTGTCAVTMSAAQSVTATFNLITYTLTVTKSGTGTGSVTSSPAGISCGSDCSEPYASGTGVTLTAAPDAGSTFAGWSGACSGTGTCALTMSANQSATASFNVVSTRGTYGNSGVPWAISSSGTTRIQAENYDTGGEGVAFHDSDTTNSGGQYRSDGVDVETTTDTGGGYNVGYVVAGEWLEYTVNVAAAGTYDLKLRLARQPTGTSAMSVAFGGIDKTGSLTVPSTGGWQTWTDVTKTGVSLSAGQQYMRITMVGADFNVNWIEITPSSAPTYALTVSKAGTGGGTVTSSPAGINCGSDCSESYASGTNVTLTATAAGGSTFAGWSGACTGTGTCAVTMSAARAVTATFNSTTPVVTIYGDALASDWSNWSWSATIDFNGASPVRVGTRAINVTYQAYGGLSLRKGTALSTSGYSSLKFWVYGGTGSNKSLRVYTQTADTSGESTAVIVTAVANTWTEITVTLSSLGNPASIKRLNIQENGGATQPMMTFDEIRLAP